MHPGTNYLHFLKKMCVGVGGVVGREVCFDEREIRKFVLLNT